MTRKEAREYIIKHCNPRRDTGTQWDDAMECAIKALGEQERKTGKWVKPLLVTNTGRVRCSECSTMYDWYTQAQYYNFCPNCGVDMRGEEHDR